MTLPGTVISSRDQTPPHTPPTDTGVWFAAGVTQKGPTEATAVKSVSAFEDTFGARVSYSLLYDCVETFFKEGGNTAIIARVVGPAAAAASVSLNDSTVAPTLKISAKSPGDWANTLKVQVVAGTTGGDFVLVITDNTLGELERSYNLTSTAEAIQWSTLSNYVTATELAAPGNPIVAAPVSLTAGNDDHGAITDSQRTAALDKFLPELGPGQVSIPGSTSATVHAALLTHATQNNRIALLDPVDSTSASTIASAATAIRALSGQLDRHGAMFTPWVQIGGYLGTTTPRQIPYSAVQAGLIARQDSRAGASSPAAGDNGISRTVTAFNAKFTDTDRETLNNAGVNVARMVYAVPKTYGYRTVASPISAPLHWQLSPVRVDMSITARANVIAEQYVFRVLDGQGHTISQFNGALSAMLLEYYPDGGLYGATPDEAFRVDTGESVNTPASIAEGILRAVIAIRRSPFAEVVEIEIVKVAVTDTV